MVFPLHHTKKYYNGPIFWEIGNIFLLLGHHNFTGDIYNLEYLQVWPFVFKVSISSFVNEILSRFNEVHTISFWIKELQIIFQWDGVEEHILNQEFSKRCIDKGGPKALPPKSPDKKKLWK